MGGVPCQSFSQAGKRMGLEDKRGSIPMESFSTLLEIIRPKVFLLENVKGLKTHNGGETLRSIISPRKYKIQTKILNSNDYGVPQKRERLIIVGVRTDINKEFRYPDEEEYKLVLRDVLEECPVSEGMEYSEKKKKIMEMIPEGGCWVDLPKNIFDRICTDRSIPYLLYFRYDSFLVYFEPVFSDFIKIDTRSFK